MSIRKTFGPGRDVDPHEALLEEVHRCAGNIAFMSEMLDSIEASVDVSGEGGMEPGEMQTLLWERERYVKLLYEERRGLMTAAKTCIQAGVAERQIALAEQQGRVLMSVMVSILNDPLLGLTREQRNLTPGLIRKHIEAVAIDATSGSRELLDKLATKARNEREDERAAGDVVAEDDGQD